MIFNWYLTQDARISECMMVTFTGGHIRNESLIHVCQVAALALGNNMIDPVPEKLPDKH